MSKKRHFLYIANCRLPSEKANGYQIMQSCQAFIENGNELTLFYPSRKLIEPELQQTPEQYYHLRCSVPSQRLWSLDLIWIWNNPVYQYFTNLFHSLSYALSLAYKLRKGRRFDHIIIRDPVLLFILWPMLARETQNKIVIELHNISSKNSSKKWLIRLLQKVPGIVSMTYTMRRHLMCEGIAEQKILASHDAVDLAVFAQPLSREQARRETHLPQVPFICAYVGKFHTNGEEKGIPETLLAAKAVLAHFPDNLLFYFIGGPMDRVHKYQKIIESQGLPLEKFIFLEKVPVDRVHFYQKAADLLLIPLPDTPFYRNYVSPLKLYEYFCANRPIVATKLPSLQEVLNQENSFLVNPSDPQDLAEGIIQVMTRPDLAKKRAEAGFKIAGKWDWLQRAKQIENFVAELRP